MNKAPTPIFFFLTGNARDGREETMGQVTTWDKLWDKMSQVMVFLHSRTVPM